jgi:DNA polymerase-3 subunit gamma/tau
MSKLGGEQTELLQISGDERARAARTALLFSEEELTRNLQIVLRTFDDLNYRQEQRFHLELGLLKLIHAQRLLPLEELLSGAVGGAGVRNSAAANPSPRATASSPRTAPAPASASVPALSPSISPFASTGSSWSAPPVAAAPKSTRPKADSALRVDSAAALAATMERTASTPAGSAELSASFGSVATLTEDEPATAPEAGAAILAAPSLEAVRHAIGAALVNAGHVSAAQLLGAGAWALEATSLRIEVPGMGKKMLALTINTASEKIIRQELQRLGAPSRFLVVPGEGAAQIKSLSDTPPVAGSIQDAALSNPLVQRAKEIFKAEVRSVVDLRQK